LFKRFENNPLLYPTPERLEEKDSVFNPTALVKDNKIYIFYRALGLGKSTICLAISEDGRDLKRYENNPILIPTSWEESKGVEDPRVVRFEGKYWMTFTAYDGKTTRIGIAFSDDLIEWEKLRLVLPGYKAGLLIPWKVNGLYCMLCMESEKPWGKTFTYLATSEDLIEWKIERIYLKPRSKKFDGWLVETGPAPVSLGNGKYLLIYNSSNHPLKKIYAPGWLIINKDLNILARSEKPLLYPKEWYECYGLVNWVIFAPGLVEFKDELILYYGAADKFICGASCKKEEFERFINEKLETLR